MGIWGIWGDALGLLALLAGQLDRRFLSRQTSDRDGEISLRGEASWLHTTERIRPGCGEDLPWCWSDKQMRTHPLGPGRPLAAVAQGSVQPASLGLGFEQNHCS